MGSHEDSRRWKREWPPPPNGFDRDLGPPYIPGASKRGRHERYFPPGGSRDIDRGPPARHGFGPRRSPPQYRSPSRRPPGEPGYPAHDSRVRGSPPQGDRRGYDWPAPRGRDVRTSWDASWRGGRLPPPPQRHPAGRETQESPPHMRGAGSGLREKPGWDTWDARGPHSEYSMLHRTTSHPGARASSSSPRNSPSFAAKGGSHRGDQLLKHTSLPHHLSSSSHSLPPGIFGAARDTPLPAPPPLLDASAAAPSPPARPAGALEALPPPLLTSDPPEAAATPLAASVALPAAPVGAGAEPAAASEEPPKRKRLGWGQGLARLRTAEAASRPVDDQPDQSPRDSKAVNHTDANPDSLSSPPFTTSIKSEPQLQLPGILSSPSDSARAALLRLVSPHSTPTTGPSLSLPAPPPLLSMDACDAWSPLEGHASVDSLGPRAQKDGITFSPRQPVPGGYHAAFDQHGGPAALQATPAAPGSMLPPAESLTKPEPEQAPQGPSKEDIMEGIDRVDTDIHALEKEVADLAASLDDTSAAAVALKGDISRLHVTVEQSPPAQLSDDEDALQTSSEVVLPGSKSAAGRPDSGMEMDSHMDLRVRPHPAEQLGSLGSLGSPLPKPEMLMGLKEGDRRLIASDEKQNLLMQQLLSSNRQRQMQAHLLLLPLAHPQMYKDDTACPSGTMAPELKDCLYLKVEGIPAVREFPRMHHLIDRAMRREVRLRAAQHRQKQKALAQQYRALYEQWQSRCAAKLGLAAKGKGGFLQRAFSGRKAARSDYEEQQMLLGLKAVEKMKQMVLIPDQMQCPYEKAMRRFENRNALIEEPVQHIQEEKKLRPWMPDEKRIFNEKFLAHPKDFRRIAQFLDGRTTGDCVVYYYRTQKLDEFAAVRRKMQLKKRRMQSENNRAISYMGISMSGAGKRGELTTIANPDFGRLQPALAPLPEALPGARSGPKPGRATRAGRSAVAGAPGPSAAKAGRLAGAQLGEGAVEAQLQHGDEDWTPADEGVPAETTKRFGRGGESSAWTASEEKLFLEGLTLYGMDFPAIRRHMGQSRTLGAVRSYFSKNRKRLDFDRIAEEAQVRASDADTLPMSAQQGHLQPSRRPSPQGVAAAEQIISQIEAGPPMGSLGGGQPMGLPGVSGGPPLGPFGLLGQGSAMGDGSEGLDMLSTLQAMSAHGGHMGNLPPMNPMQPPFSQQGMQPMGSQGMGDPGGLLAGLPQGLQGLSPHLAAQLMQAQAAQSNPMHNPLHMLQLMQNMGTLPPHMLPVLLQAQMQQMAAGGSGPHPGGLPPGMNPLLNMGMGPGGLLSGMHPLANLQNQLQNFAFLQAMQGGGMPPGGDSRQLPMGGQLPPSSFAPDSEQAYLHQQHALQQLSALESLAGQQAGPPMSAAGAGQLPSVPGLDVGPQHLRPTHPPWMKDGGHAQSVPEQQQQQQQQQQQRDFLQRPVATKAPPGGPPMRQLEVLPAMKSSASADSLAPVPHDDPAPEAVVAKRQISLWTEKEKTAFMEAYKLYGRDWAKLAAAVPSKTLTQIKNYYQNYKVKLGLDRIELPETAKQPVSRKRTKSEADSPASSAQNAPSPVGGPPAAQKRPSSTPPSVEGQMAQGPRQAYPMPAAGAAPLDHSVHAIALRAPSPSPEKALHEDQIAALEGANAAVAAANAEAGERPLVVPVQEPGVHRLTQQGESWAQAGEAVQKRLTSAQADAAAEALRARVAHFMAAQQAAGQTGPVSVLAAADPQAAGMADSAIAAQPAMQLQPSPPEVSQPPSSAPGDIDGTALIEMLRSMSQAGYSSGASVGNGPVAPHQQQAGEAASDAVLLPTPGIAQQPASMLTAQADTSALGACAPVGVQPAEAEPAQEGVPQHAAVPFAAQMDSDAALQAVPGAQPEQRTAEGWDPAAASMLVGLQLPEPEQPVQSTSAAPPEQGIEAAQLSPQQQAAAAPSLPAAGAFQRAVPTAHAPTEQAEVAEPSLGSSEQSGMPDGAIEGTELMSDTIQQAGEAALTQPNGPHAETSGTADTMQDGQDTIMPDAGEGNASHMQAAAAELPAPAEPAMPAAAGHMEAGVFPAVQHATSHGSGEREQPPSPQQPAAPDHAESAGHAAVSYPSLAGSTEEQVAMAQDGSAPVQAQPGRPADSAAFAHAASTTIEAPKMLESAAAPSNEPLKVVVAADHGLFGTGNMAEQTPRNDSAEMDIDNGAAGSGESTIHEVKHGPDVGSHVEQVPQVQVSEDKGPGTGMPQGEPPKADASTPAVAGDVA